MTSTGVRDFDRFYLGGRWVEPRGGEVIEVVSPSTEQVIARVPAPTVADVDDAVALARRTFDDGEWRHLRPVERAEVLERVADEVEQRIPELASVFAAEIGAPLPVGTDFHVKAVETLRQYAWMHESVAFTEDRGAGVRIRHEPVGVVGAIIPWTGPLAAAAVKLGPALAAGCTVVLKPAGEGPLTSYLLAECLAAAGVPDGVVSVLPGGREVGEHLVRHPEVDKIAFTGSTSAGRRIMALCADRIARVTLELGGKSAAVIGPDVGPAQVLPTLLPGAIGHSGQVCAAISRVLVPHDRRDEYAEAIAAALAEVTVGDPFDPATQLGPLAGRRQRDRVERYLAIGRAEGARVIAGGGRPAGSERGWYVEPTLFTDVGNHMRIAREEIVGPVLCLLGYRDLDDAIRIANDSPYGLSGAVYSDDPYVVQRVAREVRTGQLFVNDASMCVTQPFGGFKQSGLGREGGPEGLAGYLETKMIKLGAA